MRRGWAVSAVTLAGLCAAAAVRAQDEKPAAGAVPSGFRSYIVVDDRFPPKVNPPKRPEDRDPRDRTRMMHDLVVESGLNPTVAIFSRTVPAADSPTANLVKQLDQLAVKHRADNLGVFAIFLTLDKEFPQDDARNEKGEFLRDVKAQQVQALAAQLKAPRVPFGLAAGKSPQVDAWGVGGNDVVVVLYNRMRVVKRWEAPAGQALTDEQVKDIVATTDKVAGGK